uniref:G_PROTEIN_RECEP_F1_2 domain-containing protein n=2 Tax=Panagrellus redivivus TaxID=6233 RepID=A0A7E4UZQ3_PANRE
MSPIDVCFLTVSSILFGIYLIFIVSLIAYQNTAPLRSGFFTLTLFLGIFDVLQMVHVYAFLRFPSFGWMTDYYLRMPPHLVHYGSCAMWALAVNQHLAVVFIAINRLSAIVYPHDHKRRWRKPVRRALAAFLCASGPLYVLPKVIHESNEHYVVLDKRTRSSTLVWDDQDLLLRYKYISCITLIVASIVCLFCYGSIFYTSFQRHMTTAKRRMTPPSRNTRGSITPGSLIRKKTSRTSYNGPSRMKSSTSSIRSIAKQVTVGAQSRSTQIVYLWEKRELKLAVCGFVVFFFMFLYTVGVLNMTVDESARSQHSHRSIWLASSDIFSGINPLLLIAVSKSLRTRFLSILCCSWCDRIQYQNPSSSSWL